MIDPLDMASSPISIKAGRDDSIQETAKRLQQWENRVKARKKADEWQKTMAKKESEHQINMAKKYGAPSQPGRDWASALTSIGGGLLTALSQPKQPSPSLGDSLDLMRKYSST